MSIFAKSKRKGLPKKLHKALVEFEHQPNQKHSKEILNLINAINDSMIKEEYQSENLTEIVNTKIYRDDTVELLIRLMPFFDQQILNAMSTLLQTTIRVFPDSSLPTFLMNNKGTFDKLVSYLDQPVANTAHILIRTCLKHRPFLIYLYECGFVGSFIQYLSGDNFDKLSTAFTTYDALLNTYQDSSAEFMMNSWEIFSIQFKQLLSSPNYLVQLNFLPILSTFITSEPCRSLFYRYLDDIENLQLIMILLRSSSKKVQYRAYTLFKLFVLNPRRTQGVVSALKKNKSKLVKFLKELVLDDTDPEYEEEKQQVISIIEHLR
ncbi:putative MO25-like protein [Histomonas meleagridis]|uniref:putative MO25-like protein n=1 Tax=Histomonas meleagridis TaxID=135588 RepID=UPI00355A2503|nr:putative MO25-like protein [Histomonas meleagridis]KAH0806367.1 putative MO25-like protein [Histomonas meleagridis]